MEIKIEVAGARLDKALADLTPLSRAVANEQIKEGKVLVNGTVKKAKYTVKEGDIIQYEVPEVEEVSYEAEDLPLDIVYETRMLWWSISHKAWLFTQVRVIPVGPWSMRCYTISRIFQGSMENCVQGSFIGSIKTRQAS